MKAIINTLNSIIANKETNTDKRSVIIGIICHPGSERSWSKQHAFCFQIL